MTAKKDPSQLLKRGRKPKAAAGAPPSGNAEQGAGASGGELHQPVSSDGESKPPSASGASSPDSSGAQASADLLADIAARHQAEKGKTAKGKPGAKAKGNAAAKPADKKIEIDPKVHEFGAECTAKAEIGIMTAIFGQKWASGAYGVDDAGLLKSVWNYYFQYYGLTMLPGWLILVLGHLAYIGARLGDLEIRASISDSFRKLKATIMGKKFGQNTVKAWFRRRRADGKRPGRGPAGRGPASRCSCAAPLSRPWRRCRRLRRAGGRAGG